MSDAEIEYAEANAVRVLETNILHAADVIYWLDGSTAENHTDMQRVDSLLHLRITQKPRDAKILNSAGKTTVLRKPSLNMVSGRAQDADKQRPALLPFTLAGEARDVQRRYNPSLINVSLGSGNGQSIVVYPSPLGTRILNGGSLYGALRLNNTTTPLIWALLELTIELNSDSSQIYRAQSDGKGDFVFALNRLPPLPESISSYSATLRVTGNTTNSASAAPDTATYSAFQLQSASNSSFNAEYALTVIPGQRLRINSDGKDYLAALTT